MRNLQQKLAIARGEQPAEILFRNCNLVNVLSGETYPASVAVEDGRVVGVGDYEAKHVVDLEGAFLAPSLIDGHFHVESSMLTMPEFAKAVVPHGTGVVVIDPHEYANVLGLDGIRYVLESSKHLPLDFFIMLPSCVPATPFETAGARLTADDLRLMIADERIAGVAELMNYPGVYLGAEAELAKIAAGKGKNIDGHAPGLRGRYLNAYVLAGVRSDHESTEQAEARESFRLGRICSCAKVAPSGTWPRWRRLSLRKTREIVPSPRMTNSRETSSRKATSTIAFAKPFNRGLRRLPPFRSPQSILPAITGCATSEPSPPGIGQISLFSMIGKHSGSNKPSNEESWWPKMAGTSPHHPQKLRNRAAR